MLVENLLDEIGFTPEEQSQYAVYKSLIGDRLDACAEAFMQGKLSFSDALEQAHRLQSDALHPYTLDLMFLLECTGFLLEQYAARGIPRTVFTNTMRDMKYKLEECRKVKHIFGTFVAGWYEGFFRLTRLALGRLQYDMTRYDGEPVSVGGYTVEKGGFLLGCHIPSAGPLTPELCRQSFAEAYRFFRCRLKNGILPIRCSSWLLYPPYRDVFGEGSNTVAFADNFVITDVRKSAAFDDMWRVFGVESVESTDMLAADTRMQRSFIRYIKAGGDFGIGTGFLLFDGNEVLTKRR